MVEQHGAENADARNGHDGVAAHPKRPVLHHGGVIGGGQVGLRLGYACIEGGDDGGRAFQRGRLGELLYVVAVELGHAGDIAGDGGDVLGELSQAHGLDVRLPCELVFRNALQHPARGLGFQFEFSDEHIGERHE